MFFSVAGGVVAVFGITVWKEDGGRTVGAACKSVCGLLKSNIVLGCVMALYIAIIGLATHAVGYIKDCIGAKPPFIMGIIMLCCAAR